MQRRIPGRLSVFPDADALARALADLFVNESRAAVARHGGFYVALSGGSTPQAAYRLLAQPPLRDQVAWSDVYVYFGDERCVAPTNPLSNYLTAKQSFLDAVPLPPRNVHRMLGELDPAEAARAYADVLRADCGDPPRFDLVMLGLGKDAHTASLFPGEDPLDGDSLLVRHTFSKETQTDRLSITPTVINGAHGVVFAAEGAEKARALAAVREGGDDPARYPAQIVAPNNGNLVWLVDELAAGLLKSRQ